MKLNKNQLDRLYENAKCSYVDARANLWKALTSKSSEDSIDAFEMALTNINELLHRFMDAYSILEDEYSAELLREKTTD